MLILGLHDGHNAGAALIRDGEVLAAIPEERLRNVKNFSGTPTLAIKKVFEIAKVDPASVDAIAVACLIRSTAPLKNEDSWLVKIFHCIAPFCHGQLFTKFYVWFFHKLRRMDELKKILTELKIEKKPWHFVEHHLAHAACAYYPAPYNAEEKVLVLTLDGAGDGIAATVNIAHQNKIERLAATTTFNSLGNNLYSEITGFLGLKRWEHEYKVMGLAPYGNAEKVLWKMQQLIEINPSRPLEFHNRTWRYGRSLQKKFRRLFAEVRFDDLCAACQKHFEDLLVTWARNAIEKTGVKKIACAGGMFLNVKANKLLRELPEAEEVFFYPACDDGGTPVGAALEIYFRMCEEKKIPAKRLPLKDFYYGAEYADAEIKKVLEASREKISIEEPEDLEKRIAELLAQGKIVARFAGRDEWGPRALGNRSILADPRDLRVIRKINFAIKQRDFWMPFACSILAEDFEKYVRAPKLNSYYMIEAFDTTDRGDEIIAGCHPFDRTVRPQAVNEFNSGYQKILREFKKITGVGALLNTSFNLHGYPTAGTPEVAMETLLKSDLEALAMGKYLITKNL